MTGREIYNIWAPVGKKWVDWVRPVPFLYINEINKDYVISKLFESEMLNVESEKTAIIIDLPGVKSIECGIGLARCGFRPIPVHNGTMEQKNARATVDNESVGHALVWGAGLLKDIGISDDANPAFLLDRNRLNRRKLDASIYDNSWDVYAHDMPSADYLVKNGIEKVVIIGVSVAKDLKKIVRAYKRKKIAIYITNGYEEPKKIFCII